MCQLLADHGANLLATDKNKERALHYARRGGHSQVLDFLNGPAKNDCRKAREIKEGLRVQESSQNTIDRRRKKEGSRN